MSGFLLLPLVAKMLFAFRVVTDFQLSIKIGFLAQLVMVLPSKAAKTALSLTEIFLKIS